jgi:hypothetical protein
MAISVTGIAGLECGPLGGVVGRRGDWRLRLAREFGGLHPGISLMARVSMASELD